MAKVISQIFRMPKAGAPVTIVQARRAAERSRQFASFRCWRAWRSKSRCGATAPTRSLCSARRRTATFPPISARVRADPPGDRPHRQGGPQIRRFARRRHPTSVGTRPDGAVAMLDDVRDAPGQRARQRRSSARRLASPRQGTISFLSSIADREAIAFGEAIATPMRMKFGDYRQFEQDREASATAPRKTPRRRVTICGRSWDGCAANTRATPPRSGKPDARATFPRGSSPSAGPAARRLLRRDGLDAATAVSSILRRRSFGIITRRLQSAARRTI